MSSILDRPTPFHEANWREIQIGVSEEIIPEDFGVLSDSSGNKSKEAKSSGGVASEIRCGICCINHVDAVCPFRKYVPPDTKKYCCDICYGDHLDSVCSFREFVPEGAIVSPLYSITCSICGTVISKEQQKCPRCKPRPGCTLIRIATRNACFYCDDYRHEADACPHEHLKIGWRPSPMLISMIELGEPTSP
ncbi:hypothetical protein OROMI_009819 [Orobanche minor]